jgi:hypothetical protein
MNMRITFYGVLAVLGTTLVLWLAYRAYFQQPPSEEGKA